jgi:hypothetical protein
VAAGDLVGDVLDAGLLEDMPDAAVQKAVADAVAGDMADDKVAEITDEMPAASSSCPRLKTGKSVRFGCDGHGKCFDPAYMEYLTEFFLWLSS